MRFLSSMHPDWNISLFHYRNQGADYGRILVGIQVPQPDKAAFRDVPATGSPTRAWTRPTTRSTACSCAERPRAASAAAECARARWRLALQLPLHVGQPFADLTHVQPAAGAGAAREAAAPQRDGRQPGRTRAARRAPRPDPEHAQAALPRAADSLIFAADHGLAVDGIGDPPAAPRPRELVQQPADLAAAGVGVRAHPGARTVGGRLRRRRSRSRRTRACSRARSRTARATRASTAGDVARAGPCRHPRRHGDRRLAAPATRSPAPASASARTKARRWCCRAWPTREAARPARSPARRCVSEDLAHLLAVLQARAGAPPDVDRPGRGAGRVRRLRDGDDGRRDAGGRQQAPSVDHRRHAGLRGADGRVAHRAGGDRLLRLLPQPQPPGPRPGAGAVPAPRALLELGMESTDGTGATLPGR